MTKAICGSTDRCTSALYAPRVEETRTAAELRLIRDVTPAVRVREVFAVFGPNERRRNKGDS